MVTAINTQALGGAVAGGASADRAEQPAREAQATDDLQAVVVKISAEGARRAEASVQAAPSAQAQPARLDADTDSQVIPQQVQVSEPRVSLAGAGSAAPAVAASDSGAVSRTSQTYEPADTDEDGTVTPQERQTYETKLADEKAAAQAADSARSAEADAAVKAYEVVEQLGAAG